MTRSLFTEEVRGTVIGPVNSPYEFWAGSTKIDAGFFESDEAAIAWFKAKHPVHFLPLELKCGFTEVRIRASQEYHNCTFTCDNGLASGNW